MDVAGSALSSSFMGGGGAVVTPDGMVFNVGVSVAIAEAFEAEIAIAIAGVLAAAGFGGGSSIETIAEFEKRISKSPPNKRVAVVKEKAKVVAKDNGLVKPADTSGRHDINIK